MMAKVARILIYSKYLYPMMFRAVEVADPPKIEHKGNRLVCDFLGDFAWFSRQKAPYPGS